MIEMLGNYLPIVVIVGLGLIACVGVLIYDMLRDTSSKDMHGKY